MKAFVARSKHPTSSNVSKILGVPATTTMTPAETTTFIENEEKLWWPIVKENEPK